MQTATTSSENPVTAARNRIVGIAKQIASETDRVRAVADAMFGQEGTDGANVALQPSRSGEAGILHDEIDELELRLDTLNSQIARLTPLSFSEPRAGTGVGGPGR